MAKQTLQLFLLHVNTSSTRSCSQKMTPTLSTNVRKLLVVLVRLSSSLRELRTSGRFVGVAEDVDLGIPGTTAESSRSESCVVRDCEGIA